MVHKSILFLSHITKYEVNNNKTQCLSIGNSGSYCSYFKNVRLVSYVKLYLFKKLFTTNIIFIELTENFTEYHQLKMM